MKTSITLNADIGPCSGDGLKVGADQITINLNGHTISGDGNYENGAQAGIRITNHSVVTVNGPGTIKLFNAGVAINGGSQNSVTGITATLNKGCNSDISPAPQVCVDNNMGDGILMVGSFNNLVQNNTVTFNANANVVSGGASFASGGISMVFGSSQNHVIGNAVTDNDGTGIRVEDGGGLSNVIKGNAILRNNGNGVALRFSAAKNQVLSNDIENNAFSGVSTLLDGNKNVIVGNNVRGNTTGVNLGSSGNIVRGNAVSSNATNGISVGGGSVFVADDGNPTGEFIRRDNVVQNNAVRDNGGNGIIVVCAKDGISANPTLHGKCLTTTYTDGNGQPISTAENDSILNNVAKNNGGANAGVLVRDGSGNPIGTFDLLDQNEKPPCDHNTWSGNSATTGYPACTLNP